jgi:Fe-S-cluster containining protein
MAICDDIRATYCKNACCYIKDKEITRGEAATLGEKGAIRREGEWFLRNDPETGACVYLDQEKGGCSIYNNRLEVCKGYSCVKDTVRIESIIESLDAQQPSLRKSMIQEFRHQAAEYYPDLDPQEAFEVMFPELN